MQNIDIAQRTYRILLCLGNLTSPTFGAFGSSTQLLLGIEPFLPTLFYFYVARM